LNSTPTHGICQFRRDREFMSLFELADLPQAGSSESLFGLAGRQNWQLLQKSRFRGMSNQCFGNKQQKINKVDRVDVSSVSVHTLRWIGSTGSC
jgi:hypothetical protein